ncbi:MAG: DUF1801 domain-containing protein [Chitinophagales bacterium]|nr:DUF1801 domain-containing protein [Chitinophagaceae bacterium]MCB9065745.1 DUF1801 domain-containing protein [Chitinophagales bacterium]
MKTAADIYDHWDEPQKSCLLALRQIILDTDDSITETVKYGMPCFCIAGKHFCYLWTDKHTNDPYILMVEGNKLTHPKLLQGDRKRMKVFTVDPTSDLPVNTIKEILNEALTVSEL